MMDVLLQELGLHYKFNAYADDLLLLVDGQSRAELERRGTKLMQTVAEWSKRVGVEIFVDKTVMLLKGRLSLTRLLNIQRADKAIKYVKQVKYLGLTVDHLKVVRTKMMTVAVWSDILNTVLGQCNLLTCQRIPLLPCLAVCCTVST